MITKNQESVINLFRKNIFLNKTIRQISLMLEKPYPKVYEAVKDLERQSLLKLKTAGNSRLCELNLSPGAISTLAYFDTQEAISRKIPNIERLLDFKDFREDIVLVTGSYAKGKQKATSDIDLVIITKLDTFKKAKLLENLTLIFRPEYHPIVFSQKDFIDMLLDKEENFGKEVFKNHIIFRNAERYYILLKEAIEYGYRS